MDILLGIHLDVELTAFDRAWWAAQNDDHHHDGPTPIEACACGEDCDLGEDLGPWWATLPEDPDLDRRVRLAWDARTRPTGLTDEDVLLSGMMD